MSSEKARGSQIQLPGGLLPDILSSMQDDIDGKASTGDVALALADKADKSELSGLATEGYVDLAVGGRVPEAPEDGKQYARKNAAWVEATGGGVPEAPVDGKQYSRKDGAWVETSVSPLLRMEYISGAKTLVEADAGKTFVVTASATVTLPTAPSDGWAVEFLMSDASSGSARTVTWAKDAGDSIRGGVTVATGDCAVVYLDNVFIVTGAQE